MAATIDIVIPVYNEEQALPRSILILSDFLKANLTNPWQVIIADNASTDGTRKVAEQLARKYAGVHYLHMPQKGRGRALRTAWLQSTADIVCYMDVDLSTELVHLPELIQSLEAGYDIAVGSRLSPGSRVTRSFKREAISRIYNRMIRIMFFTSFDDAQCGFKALTRQAARAIIPQVKNNNWFFDTEMLIIAAKGGYRIAPVPVRWLDDPTTTVKIFRTVTEDIKGLLRLRLGGVPKVAPPEHRVPRKGPVGEAVRS
ncbi:MAG: glycosyltransferase family 2 protein [Dehalococcoidia bacterium]|nr:glycosyltransferase family 2 protein [Dehalococcoidia bacterium]MSQ17441.1 glycosyltransferase family 2 protein [Dehalococcoidia bacterium]